MSQTVCMTLYKMLDFEVTLKDLFGDKTYMTQLASIEIY